MKPEYIKANVCSEKCFIDYRYLKNIIKRKGKGSYFLKRMMDSWLDERLLLDGECVVCEAELEY